MAPCRPHYCQWGCCSIPQRVTLAIFLHLALQNAYNMRQVLNLAVVAMVSSSYNGAVDACPNYKEEKVEKLEGGKFEWDSRQEALVLYAFFIGYFFSHMPGGFFADKYGGRHVLSFSLVGSIIITCIFPLATIHIGFPAAVVLRCMLGLAQGPILPCISSMMSSWIPPEDRAILGSISYSGSTVGTVLGNILTGAIIEKTKSWPNAFYFWALVALVWYFFYLLYAFSTPNTHPFLTKSEAEFLRDHVEEKTHFKVPWKKIFKNSAFWANLCGNFGHNYIFFTIVVYLPTFMKDILKMDIQSNAVYSSIPFIFMWVFSFFWGGLASYIAVHQLVGTSTMRKIYGSGSNIVSSAIIVAAVYVGCNRMLVVVLYIVSLVIKAQYYSSLTVNVNDMSKHFGGTMYAIINAVSSLSGVIGPLLIGEFTKDKSLYGWRLVFWVMFAVSTFTSIIFIIWGSADRQEFDMVETVD